MLYGSYISIKLEKQKDISWVPCNFLVEMEKLALGVGSRIPKACWGRAPLSSIHRIIATEGVNICLKCVIFPLCTFSLFLHVNILIQLSRCPFKRCSVLGFQESGHSRQKGTTGVLMIYHVYDPWIKRPGWVRPLWFIASGSRELQGVWGEAGISAWTVKVRHCWFTWLTKLAQNER